MTLKLAVINKFCNILNREPSHDINKEIVKMVGFLLWCILFVLCWPLAILALLLYPIVWLLLLPFHLLGITTTAVLALFAAIIFLPARILGYRRT